MIKQKETIYGKTKEQVRADMERYQKMAVDLGAADAIIVSPAQVIQSQRAAYNCIFINSCVGSGTCYFCPPQFPMSLEVAVAIKECYDYILLTRQLVPYALLSGPACQSLPVAGLNLWGKFWKPKDVKYWQDYREKHQVKMWPKSPFAAVIEQEARKDGYQFAFTAKLGTCMSRECNDFGSVCIMRTSPLCRFPTEVRPDGSSGMYTDILKIAEKFGWQQAVMGWSALPEEIPEELSTVYIWPNFHSIVEPITPFGCGYSNWN